MSVLAKEYTDLDRALDEVRTMLQNWSDNQDEGSSPRAETLRYTQLVLHEWIANLLQHANFEGGTPTVRIRLESKDRDINCSVLDNSKGFDFEERLPPDEIMEDLPERGMGLRIINACTDDLSYTSTESGLHCLEFSIPADHDPWLSMLF